MSRHVTQWTEVDGLRVHARVWEMAGPDAPAVVLVHGLSMSGRYLVPTAERLARHARVYVPDLPGFGESEAPDSVLDVEGLTDALDAWMGAVGLSGAVLLGNSLGCQVLLDLAARHPHRARALVLVGPTVDPAGRSRVRLVARAAVDVFREQSSLYPVIVSEYLKAGVVQTWKTLRFLTDDRPEARFEHVRQPVLVVRGARDAIVPAAWAERVARALPHGRLLTVPGAAHAVNFGAPGPLSTAVLELMSGPGMDRHSVQ